MNKPNQQKIIEANIELLKKTNSIEDIILNLFDTYNYPVDVRDAVDDVRNAINVLRETLYNNSKESKTNNK